MAGGLMTKRVVEVSILSTVYIRQRVRVEDAGTEIDPTELVVRMAFTDASTDDVDPIEADWKGAIWQTAVDGWGKPVYYAQCLIGPGSSVALASGRYRIWVEATSVPQKVVLKGGIVLVE